ncbi:MAG TPA: tetratricopeptide repeat protein, partial [Anaerolineae bacterium]|nr:tetratricopeptide repeat protein [Anaerolineae bacterium]
MQAMKMNMRQTYIHLTVVGVISAAVLLGLCACETTSGNAMSHLELGRSYMETGRWDEAIAELETAIRLDPDLAEAHFRLGNVYAQRGELDKAAEEFKAIIRLNERDAAAHSNLGVVYYRQGRLNEAIVEYQTALALTPN